MRRALLICIGLLVVSLVLLKPSSLAGAPARVEPDRLNVLYLGPGGAVKDALTLSPYLHSVSDLSQAQVIVVDDEALSASTAAAVRHAVTSGAGLLLIPGPHTTGEMLAGLLGSEVSAQQARDAVGQVVVRGADDVLERNVVWNSAPQVRERTRLTMAPGSATLVKAYETGEPVLAQMQVEAGSVFVLTPWLTAEANGQLSEWPYFKYLLYHLAVRAGGATPVSFADYPLSPVPQGGERAGIVLLVALMISTTIGVFVLVRRYSRQHPELLDRLVGHADAYRRNTQAGAGDWEQVGFQRPLAGFLIFFSVALIMFIPLMIYQVIVVPRLLVPSVQTYGTWNWVVNWFQLFWALFDMGTSMALVKYLSELRVDKPREGMKYVQIFVWWQAITGTIQLGSVAILSAYVLPQTALGYMAYYFIFHALIQFPGFLRVFQFTLRALQRTDADQTLNILASPGPQTLGILVIVVQTAAVLLFRGVIGANTAVGPAMGAALAMGVGLYLTEISFFLVSLWLYRRLGFAARLIFLAHFDGEQLKRALLFGFPVMIGGIFGALGWFVQGMLMQRYLVNYTEAFANWNNAWQLIIAYSALGSLYEAFMPAASEAFSHGRLHLLRYYIAQGFKYGGWLSAWILGSFLAIGDRFILGALGQQWVRAAQLVGVLMIWGALQYPAWLADKLQQGAGKPYLNALFLIIEQSLRIALMFAFVQRFQLMGMVMAYMVALPLKDVLAWVTNWRLITPFRIHWWQSAIAPLLAGAIVYLTMRLVGNLIWQPNLISSLALFMAATLPCLPYYCFWNGLFGGWDADGLEELRLASEMTPFRALSAAVERALGRIPGLRGERQRVVVGSACAWLVNPAYLIYRSTALGAGVSRLHNRFPIPTTQAMEEARSLTDEKVSLA